jgi:hypothetical protein
MKNKRNTCPLNLILSFALLLAAFTGAQAQAKPDLIFTDASMTKQRRGSEIYQITVTVTVTNYCNEAIAGKNDIALYFDTGDPGTNFATFQAFPSLKGGESLSMTYKINKDAPYFWNRGLAFLKWLNKTEKMPRARFVIDLLNKVKEADENNNWWELNPQKTPAKLSGQFQCSPKV